MNQVILQGVISKIYPELTTPSGILVTRLVVKHSSTQEEAGAKRQVKCQVFCVALAKKVSNEWLNHEVLLKGFLSLNNERQLVLHINSLELVK